MPTIHRAHGSRFGSFDHPDRYDRWPTGSFTACTNGSQRTSRAPASTTAPGCWTWAPVPGGSRWLRELRRVLRPGGQAWIYDVRFALGRAEAAARAVFPSPDLHRETLRTGWLPLRLIGRLVIDPAEARV